MTPEERCERVRMALAEAGYPRAVVFPGDEPGQVFVTGAPRAVIWRAFRVAIPDALTKCWPCHVANPHVRGPEAGCTHDVLTCPWPEVVR